MPQTETHFDELQHGGEVAILVRDVVGFCIWRNDEQRNARPIPEGIQLGWRDVVIKPTIIVPSQKDRAVVPVAALHQSIDQPRRVPHALGYRTGGMLAIFKGRNQPSDVWQHALPKVSK